MTDPRLLCLAGMVPQGIPLADIGSDHAYLPIYLVQNGKIPFAIASDIGDGPCRAAARSVRRAGLGGRIQVRRGDGLSTVKRGEAGTIAIAGMGGETIVSILKEAAWVKEEGLCLLLQPMSRGETLRKWLFAEGFAIDEEHIAEDRGHLYAVMRAHFSPGTRAAADPIACYTGAIEPNEGRDYFRREAAHLKNRARGETGSEKEALLSLAARLEAL